ncbi:hypothetical protein FB45DRAFT_1017658 [Roridomyces roridus]|uniref:Uncharacterized protein n=1 Tax=Roridomyces roridus TaxID=1738132 RepID=A0AAD7CJ09_9AGAR|nr:hypothetical protein FB45DRAFT_1017658 [Roridomyces roridus]
MLARRNASAKYRGRNEEELREKARIRMQLCVTVAETPELQEDARARARESSRKYRASHAAALAHRQRIRRMDAYEKKHGHKAWLERSEKLETQRRAAAEEEEWRVYEVELRRRERERETGAA